MHKYRALRHIALAFLLLAVAGNLSAQNVVLNPNFDTQLSPWTQFLSAAPDPSGAGAAPMWVAVDISNSPSSGAGQININTTTPAGDAASGIAQCVDFGAATSISFINYGMSFRIPAATTADTAINATVEVRLFSGAGCSGFIAGGSQGRDLLAGLPSDTTWYTVGDNSFTPAGGPVLASSAQFRAYLRQVNGVGPTTTSYTVDYDAAHLVLNSATPVRLQQFDVE